MSDKKNLPDLNQPSRGLGDTIAKITSATKLDKLANSIAVAVGAEDCGCKARQESLNKLVPYKNGRTFKNFPTKE
jgi:hypothetical protein